jgi:hypothetical protein
MSSRKEGKETGEKEEWRREERRKGDMANKKREVSFVRCFPFFVVIFENYSDKLNFI